MFKNKKEAFEVGKANITIQLKDGREHKFSIVGEKNKFGINTAKYLFNSWQERSAKTQMVYVCISNNEDKYIALSMIREVNVKFEEYKISPNNI